MTTKKIRSPGPVTLEIEVNDEDETLCHGGCDHFWTEPIFGELTDQVRCILGRLRWKDDYTAYRHKNCLAGKPVKKRKR